MLRQKRVATIFSDKREQYTLEDAVQLKMMLILKAMTDSTRAPQKTAIFLTNVSWLLGTKKGAI